MALILKKLYHNYYSYFYDQADKRFQDNFMIGSPVYPVLLIGAYLYFVKNLGPKLMENRHPFKLKGIIIGYNCIQVILNALLVCSCFKVMLNYNWYCQPIDYGRSSKAVSEGKMVYYYFLLKLLDILDTIFFVLRKKTKQVSFLHVYHHTFVVTISWLAVKFWAGGHTNFVVITNSFVHVIMYFYYFITIYKPEYRNTAWIKKYITLLQIVQFAFYIIMYTQILLWSDCTFPKTISYFCIPQNAFLFVLFSDFYIRSYKKEKKLQKDKVHADIASEKKIEQRRNNYRRNSGILMS